MLQLIDISFNAVPPASFLPRTLIPFGRPTHPTQFYSPSLLPRGASFCGRVDVSFLFLRACGSVVSEAAATPLFSFFTITSRPNIFPNQTQVGVKEGHLPKTAWAPLLSPFPHTQQFPLKPDNGELFTYFHKLNTLETVPQMSIKKHKP